MESSRGECERRIGEIKSSVGRMCKLAEVFWESVPKSWCSVGKGAVEIDCEIDIIYTENIKISLTNIIHLVSGHLFKASFLPYKFRKCVQSAHY